MLILAGGHIMEGSSSLQEIGFLLKAFGSQCKTILLCFLPLLFLPLALPHLESLMPTMWHALAGFSEGPAFAFLLLNCVVATIIASSKLESEQIRELAEESNQGTILVQLENSGDVKEGVIGENAPVMSHNYHTSIHTDDYHMGEGENSLENSCSLNAHYNQEPPNHNINAKKPNRRARLACRQSSNKTRLHPNKPLKPSPLENHSDNSMTYAHQKRIMNLGQLGRAGLNNICDHTPPPADNQYPASAPAVAHPSSEEVWATIMSSNKSDHHRMQEQTHNTELPPDQKAAAPQCETAAPAAAVYNLPAAAANALGGAKAAANGAVEASSSGKAAAEAKQENGMKSDGDAENDSELEELNRRAEEFIARFNRQMRLQRQESLQRQRRGGRLCNHEIQYQHHQRHLQLPARGLLVG